MAIKTVTNETFVSFKAGYSNQTLWKLGSDKKFIHSSGRLWKPFNDSPNPANSHPISLGNTSIHTWEIEAVNATVDFYPAGLLKGRWELVSKLENLKTS